MRRREGEGEGGEKEQEEQLEERQKPSRDKKAYIFTEDMWSESSTSAHKESDSSLL